MSQADVQKLWNSENDALLSNEIRLRTLAFEPEPGWLDKLTKTSNVPCAQLPTACDALRKLMPAPPGIDQVTKVAPGLLNQLREAAQKKDVAAMQPLVHPELMTDKAKVYELFDPSNYRGHVLGRYTDVDGRVGVQFFELTLSQVETVHYVWFASSRGKIVVRDVETGPQVAELFLRDEEKLALAKLDLVFRALNDGDEAGLKTLCTPGLYQSIQELGGDKHPGDRITRGHLSSQVSLKPSVPLDQKSVRVVVRVAYLRQTGQSLAFDVDFERIENDLKVVRLRDMENKVIAWDPDIDNYLNRRFNLPDGPKQVEVGKTTEAAFLPLATIRLYARRAVEDRKEKELRSDAQEFRESAPQGGEGDGLLASADYMIGDDDKAEKESIQALQHGGTVYLTLLRHATVFQGSPFAPVTLEISKEKILYTPLGGARGNPEEIPISSIMAVDLEKGGNFKSKRPFLKLDFKVATGKKMTYNFAAFGTACQGQTPANPNVRLVAWPGGGACGVNTTNGTTPRSLGGVLGSLTIAKDQIPMMVPTNWEQDLKVVMRTIDQALQATQGQR